MTSAFDFRCSVKHWQAEHTSKLYHGTEVAKVSLVCTTHLSIDDTLRS